MKSFGVILIIFLNLCVASAQNYDENYSCNQTTFTCTLRNFSNTENFQNFLSKSSEVYYMSYHHYYGRQRSSISMSSLLYVELENVKVDKLPPLLFSRFTRVANFKGSNMGLKEIKSEDFKNAKNLKVLNLTHNEIKQLENVQFIYLKNIEEIYLSYNKISSIHDGAFDKIGTNLTKIDLQFNEITIFKEEYLNLISNMIGLTWINQTLKINLEHNMISEWVPSDKNYSNSVILNLNLNDNKLKSFKLQNIKINVLSLTNNEIEELDGNFKVIGVKNNKIKSLKIGEECTKIFASNNQISEIIFEAQNSTELEVFDVSFNNLKSSQSFHDFLKNQKKISSLDLSHNYFGSFALEDFADMENLQKLSLSNTGLSEIPFGLFAHLQKLQNLNISQNNLKEIDFHVFSSLGNLEELDISGNKISKIEEYDKMKEVLSNLKRIGLEGNNWNCEYLSKLKISLKSQSIDIIEPRDRAKSESSVMGIKCIESSQMKIQELKNGTVDEFISSKLNEVINKVNQLDKKVSTIKSNETNVMSLIVNNQKDILDLKGEKFKAQLSSANYTNSNEVKMLIDQMNNNTMEKQKIAIDQLLHKINELALKVDQNKLDNEKMILKGQQSQKSAESLSLKSSNDKSSGISTAEFILGIFLAMTLTLLIILVFNQLKNYVRRNSFRMPRMSGRNTPNTIVTYDSQSVQ